MIREKITHKDFFKISRENDHYLWHFVQKDQHKNSLELSSIIDGDKEKNPLKIILDGLDIPYYESYVEDSIDFLMGLGCKHEHLYNNRPIIDPNISRNFRFGPVMIGFKKFTNVLSTHKVCYCSDGVINIINELDPKYLEQILINLEKNPD